MSDNFKIIGVGGAGVNAVRSLGYHNSILIDGKNYPDVKDASDVVGSLKRTELDVVVSSPSGEFSSSVLTSLCNLLHSRKEKVLLVSIMPFLSESPERKQRGERLLRDIKGLVDSSILVENENFASSMLDRPWTEALDNVNRYIGEVIQEFISRERAIAGGVPDLAQLSRIAST